MTRQRWDERGVAPLLQSACAVISGLLLVGVLAYAMAATEVDLAGGLPPGHEVWAAWQQVR